MTTRPTTSPRGDVGVSCFAPPPAGAGVSRVPDEAALARLAGVRAHEAMVTAPDTLDPSATVAQAREAFADDHVHMLLVVTEGRLAGTVVRDDLAEGLAPDTALLQVAHLRGRTISPDAAAADALRTLVTTGRRRVAVVDAAGRLLGLLCLKRSGLGFCSDADVASRAGDPRS